ncbi:MAG: SCP2 sterol-binding domain-containing protein [Acidimicrobiia bacterium]
MVRFLSDEWVEALDAAAQTLPVPSEVDLTVQQVVHRPGSEDARYHLVFAQGVLRVRPGQAPAPVVTVTQTYEVARALARAEVNAQQALAEGRLRISGGVEALARYGKALGAIGDVFAPVRAVTEYP